ncbi:MAG: hypothetical protein HY261_04800 [Chloroflexi bacterium]|nr:hypothetical protein [Chloroflexota bacterium]
MAKSAASCFEAVSAVMIGEGATPSKMFGAVCLKTGPKAFAMLYKNALVVKLPAERVAAVIKSGKGEPFDPGMGRTMKEWVNLPTPDEKEWTALARESRKFVASAATKNQK